MALWARVLWDLLFFSIILVAIVGNLIVLWVVVGESWTITAGLYGSKYCRRNQTYRRQKLVFSKAQKLDCVCRPTNGYPRQSFKKTFLYSSVLSVLTQRGDISL